jgi:hypothetical protein
MHALVKPKATEPYDRATTNWPTGRLDFDHRLDDDEWLANHVREL